MKILYVLHLCNLSGVNLCGMLKPSDAFLYFLRPKWEGGQYDGDDNSRLDTLRLAMELGADYVDVELQVSL